MRICRFTLNDKINFGLWRDDEEIAILSDLFEETGGLTSLSNVRLLPPAAPSKIVCVGRNYSDHAKELGNKVPDEPLLFLKPPSSLVAHFDPILLPPASQQVEHEAELAVVIGKPCSRLANDTDTAEYIKGYTCLNDVTARDLQKKDIQFTRAKSFDTFCPVGPFIDTDFRPAENSIECYVNGELRQSARLADMVFDVQYLIRYISNIMTLLPGDIIATGTPAGVSPIKAGDVCEVVIDGLGTLRNVVTAAPSEVEGI